MKYFALAIVSSVICGVTACGGSGGGGSAAPTAPTATTTSTTNAMTGGTANSVCHPSVTEATQTPDFAIEIIPAGDPLYGLFYKCTKVFGLQLLAIQSYPDAPMLQTATIAAEYLDNNEDGVVDNSAVNSQLQSSGSGIWLGEDAPGGNAEPPHVTDIQTRGAAQIAYMQHRVDIFVDAIKGGTYCGSACGEINDTAIEHVPEIIQKGGYVLAYPSDFGPYAGTTLANAMDTARGGYWASNPVSYPASAWYTGEGLPYDGHMIEYFAWGLVTNLGLLGERSPNACAVFANEWTLCTKAEFQATDTKFLAILNNSQFVLPTVAPDGSYR